MDGVAWSRSWTRRRWVPMVGDLAVAVAHGVALRGSSRRWPRGPSIHPMAWGANVARTPPTPSPWSGSCSGPCPAGWWMVGSMAEGGGGRGGGRGGWVGWFGRRRDPCKTRRISTAQEHLISHLSPFALFFPFSPPIVGSLVASSIFQFTPLVCTGLKDPVVSKPILLT